MTQLPEISFQTCWLASRFFDHAHQISDLWWLRIAFMRPNKNKITYTNTVTKCVYVEYIFSIKNFSRNGQNNVWIKHHVGSSFIVWEPKFDRVMYVNETYHKNTQSWFKKSSKYVNKLCGIFWCWVKSIWKQA